jgi:hypothetical protein
MISPVTFFTPCAECKALVGPIGEWCMLKNTVWEKVWPGTCQTSVHAPMPMKHNLCIGCIEKRLGRRLTRADFDLRSKHNRLNADRQFPMSQRLRKRLVSR